MLTEIIRGDDFEKKLGHDLNKVHREGKIPKLRLWSYPFKNKSSGDENVRSNRQRMRMKATNSFTDSCLIGKEKKKSMVEILSRQGQSLLNDDDIEAEFIDFYRVVTQKEMVIILFLLLTTGTHGPLNKHKLFNY